MVAAITQVAKVMQLETVAEYVESEKTCAVIARLGVDYAQGHAVGKPIPLDEVLGDVGGPPADRAAATAGGRTASKAD
jgi:EAL domain-containing protein (putative c-di-GMP-specific phosphodiesterase class I)